MSAHYILYDLPSRDPCKCWSLNPWKTRLLLNYKTLPYETQWVEYPDIKSKFEKLVPPHKEGANPTPYTIPTVQFPDGTYMQESRDIAERIEREHPNPTMHLNSDILKQVEGLMGKIRLAFNPEFLNKVPKRLLNEASLPYWYETREARTGMPLDQFEREKGGDVAYQNVAPFIQEVTQLLKANDSGPFFEGNQVTYVDFVWAAYLRFLQRIGDDVFENILKVSGDAGVHRAQINACSPWLARDDH